MTVLWFFIGILGGLLGGMGMGGGTLLIPLLTGLGGVDQHVAQAVNLIAFVPMSVVALLIHARNGYVRTRGLTPLIVSAVLSAGVFSVFAQLITAPVLKRGFGIFLVILGICLLTAQIMRFIKKKRTKNKNQSPAG